MIIILCECADLWESDENQEAWNLYGEHQVTESDDANENEL